jgi:hypothetical protein
MPELVADYVTAIVQPVAEVDGVKASRSVVVEAFMVHVRGIRIGIEVIGILLGL